MSSKRYLYASLAVVAVVLLMALFLTLASCQQCPAVVQGVSHLEGLAISGSETDALVVNQASTGDIVELRDNGSVVFRVADGGDVVVTGMTDLRGSVWNTAGYFSIGDNTVITGTADFRSSLWNSEGYFTIGDNAVITGTADFRSSLWNTAGYLTVGDDVVVTGTTDLRGSVWNTAGFLTVGDDVVITGTTDLLGSVWDSEGDFTIGDNVVITGTLDAQCGVFLTLTEGDVVVVTYGGTITPLSSFQPITSSAPITNAVIDDGTAAGQIVVISNENASNDIVILESGSNLAAGGDITLSGGAYDLVTLLWDGARWIRLAFFDN
jgi:hypothetical protein